MTKNKGGRPTKWTLEKALELGNSLIEWQLADENHLYWNEYIVIKRGLHAEIIRDLTSKYDEFSQLIKRAKEIQEIKLLKKEGKGEIKSLFVLKNHHGYADRSEVKTENITYNYDAGDLRQKTVDELQDLLNIETNTTQ